MRVAADTAAADRAATEVAMCSVLYFIPYSNFLFYSMFHSIFYSVIHSIFYSLFHSLLYSLFLFYVN